MRLLIDENLASHELKARLTKAGHYVEIRQKGTEDPPTWRYAQEHSFVVLTANAPDFETLARTTPEHRGLLAVYGERNPPRQMRAADIAAAIEYLGEVLGEDLMGRRLVLNEWRRPRTGS